MAVLRLLILGASTACAVLAHAGGGAWEPLHARYLIHSQSATYPEAPTKADRMLTVVIEDKAAKELFDLIGPDSKLICSSEKGDRARHKKGVNCIYTAQDANSKEGPYRCWIGLNIRTGEGDVRVSC